MLASDTSPMTLFLDVGRILCAAACALAITVVLCFVLHLIISCVAMVLQAYHEEIARELHEAAQRYEPARTAVVKWIPQCWTLLKNCHVPYERGCPMRAARRKSLRLIGRALSDASFLHRHDISPQSTEAGQELQRLDASCSACKEINKGSIRPRCQSMTPVREIEVDLQFRKGGVEAERDDG